MQVAPTAGLYNTLKTERLRGHCIVKIHFTEGLPSRIRQDPAHSHSPADSAEAGSALATSAESSRVPGISLHLGHFLYMKILPQFFHNPVPGQFLLHQRSLTYNQLAVYHFIFHYWFNIDHTWK